MSDRLAQAQAALNAGRRDEAIDHLIAAIADNPVQPAQVYRVLVVNLYSAGRWEDGIHWATAGLKRYPRDYDMLNSRGVFFRKVKRYPQAVADLETALKLNPKNPAAASNLGNVLSDMGEQARAEQVFAKLARLDPRNSEYQRQLGRALAKQGKIEPALTRLRQAVTIKRDNVDAWLDMVGILNEEHRTADSEAQLDKALAALPGNPRLLEGKIMVLKRSGQQRRAEAFMEELLPANPDAAWLHYQLGTLVADWDRPRANVHLRKAVTLDPSKLDYATSLIESLERTRGPDEGRHIEESYQLALKQMPPRPEFNEAAFKVLNETFIRVCDYDSMEALGDFKTLGRGWARTGRHGALLKQLARVKTDEDRLELVEQHRIWGRDVETGAARRPIRRPVPRAPGEKIRLGLMSSDLRQHPVGYFALPLFDDVDPRFDVFIYSYNQGQEDAAIRYITSKVTAYRWWKDISIGEAAQKIADDDLDILIELGGSTHMNKPEVMAYRPAPLQASWLGYPHSLGLEAIDYFVCDQYSRPTDPRYLIETPLEMPHTWLALGQQVFHDSHEVKPELPSDRNGFITFGTANNPHKYSREVLRAWARVVAAVPGSRFAFIRPEGLGASFRGNIEAQFALEGVAADRIDWRVVRGQHLPHYNEVDVTLDPFPLTGGTTTAESLWMGVPLVSLRGEAFFERLSYSILSNAGLGDLVASNLDEYQDLALKLAADTERRRQLRTGLREMIRSSPLGQTKRFAADFYEMCHRAVMERPGLKAAG